jgi:hypothetical protein
MTRNGYCCLSVDGKRPSQISVPFVLVCDQSHFPIETLEDKTADYVTRIAVDDENYAEQVRSFHPVREDLNLLKCSSCDSKKSVWGPLKENTCVVQIFQPTVLRDESEDTSSPVMSNCRCCHPQGNWNRHNLMRMAENRSAAVDSIAQDRIQIIDLASLQLKRRIHGSFIQVDATGKIPLSWVRMNQPSAVLHILRSSLQAQSSLTSFPEALHFASPWKRAYEQSSTIHDHTHYASTTICLTLLYSSSTENENQGINQDEDELQSWKSLEMDELKNFITFRTGDAIPSYYLYSVNRFCADHTCNSTSSFWRRLFPNTDAPTAADEYVDPIFENELNMNRELELVFLIYKPLPPRSHLLQSNPESSMTDVEFPDFCLWEKYTTTASLDGVEGQQCSHAPENTSPQTLAHVSYRRIAPPFQNHSDIYPEALDHLLEHANFMKIVQEALSIPDWIAWPERNHYHDARSDLDGNIDETDRSESWTVFPLCHTFPATDVNSRKWIRKTCEHVPHTVSLLQNHPILSPLIRTALFSRLQPRTTLGAHTGWADLANFVLRVHIPIVVPNDDSSTSEQSIGDEFNPNYNTKTRNSNNGLCGLWVDGCVETHEEGRILCFDDSKVHRAFNYSNKDRIVLILDLVRPKGEISSCATLDHPPDFPYGYSEGGHTEELDAFIREYE